MSEHDKLRLEAPHYFLRTLEAKDASERWARWLLDPDTARMLNAPARVVTLTEIRGYIATFDGHTRHLLGIFEKDTRQHVGFWAVYVDWKIREFTVNVLIGETQARSKGAREESRGALYRHFFGELKLEAARCSVLAHNASTLRVMDSNGWELTGTSTKPAVGGGEPVELRFYRLPRETWLDRGGAAMLAER